MAQVGWHSVIPREVGGGVVMDWSTKKMVPGGCVQVGLEVYKALMQCVHVMD